MFKWGTIKISALAKKFPAIFTIFFMCPVLITFYYLSLITFYLKSCGKKIKICVSKPTGIIIPTRIELQRQCMLRYCCLLLMLL